MKSHIDLIASGGSPLAADGQSVDIVVATGMMATVNLYISAVSGSSTPTLYFWLEHKDDTSSQYVPLPFDQQLTAPATIGDDVTAATNKKNVTGASGVTAAGHHVATYKHLASGKVRARWRVTGSFTAGQGFTVAAGMDVA